MARLSLYLGVTLPQDLLSRLLGRTDFGPRTNGARAEVSPEAKGLPVLDVDFAGPNSASWTRFGGADPDAEDVDRNTAYAAAVLIYTAIRYRAENIAEPPALVHERTEQGWQPLPDHPVSELLARPSPDWDGGELIETTQTFWDLDGRALIVTDQDMMGRPGRLTPFSGNEIRRIESDGDRLYGRFIVKTRSGDREIPAERAVFLKYTNPYDRKAGLSPTDVALGWMNLGMRTKATIKSLLRNALFPSIVLQTDPDWQPDDDEWDRFQDSLRQYAKTERKGEPLAVTGGGKATRVAFTLEDLLPETLLNRVEANVASAFGIAPVVLGWLVGLQNSPWSQMAEARTHTYEDTLIPLWNNRWARKLTQQLLRPVDDNPDHEIRFDLTDIRALQDDESQKVEDARRAIFWTVDEARAHTGMEPLEDERGEMTVAELEASSRGPQTLSLEGMSGRPPTEAKSRPESNEALDRQVKLAWFAATKQASRPAWFRMAAERLEADRKRALALFDDAAKGWPADFATKQERPDDPEELKEFIRRLDEAEMEAHWEEAAGPLIREGAENSVRAAASEVGISFDVLDPALQRYAEKELGFLTQSVGKTTRDRIIHDLRKGYDEGEGIPELRKRIEESAAFSRDRATLIARTETTRITNGAQRETLSDYQGETQNTIQKQWVSARDGRVRPDHRAQDDGKWYGVDEVFPETGVSEPSEPNCRCTLGYRLVEDEAA